jgi:putative redox protein
VDAKVTWGGKLAFTGTADSGFNVSLDGKASVGGEENGFQPMELMAISLAGCTAMDVISILRKKRQDVTDFDVQVHAKRASEHPKVFSSAIIDDMVAGHGVDEAAVVRAIELSATRYCPAQAMLGQVMPIELKYHIYEDEGDGQRTLVKDGVYTIPDRQVQA